ncbi:MAG: nicotinate-nucleotide diphosphorylase (carboxylating), partial [Bacteroidetes bacterium]|nr:nicotinate-nucleotide diphosphorylase (carboxylating) [Bacteroidota bacterium]
MIDQNYLDSFLNLAIREDLGDGDHTSLATIPENTMGKARLLIKENGVLAGVDIASKIFRKIDPSLAIEIKIQDGAVIENGNEVLYVNGNVLSILQAERLVL